MSSVIVQGNALRIPLADNSVQCTVTSVPYWGLRKYLPAGDVLECQELGMERTPAEYVANMVRVFEEVRRVLRDDGVLFLNCGDSYAGSGQGVMGDGTQVGGVKQRTNAGSMDGLFGAKRKALGNLKPKDLCLIPQRLAIALQDAGWWVRSEIIWAKTSCMPESVTDRCTRSHETIWLLTKSAQYFYDAQAVAEKGVTDHMTGRGMTDTRLTHGAQSGGNKGILALKQRYHDAGVPTLGRNRRDVWTINPSPLNSVEVYGTYRIASQDCPVHDYQADLSRVLEYDARLSVSDFLRNLRSDGRHDQLPEGAVVSIPLDRFESLSDVSFAISRNTRMNKTVSELERDVTFFGIPADHTEYMELVRRSVAKYARKHANNTEQDVSTDGLDSYLLAQTLYRIFCILTFEKPPSKCTCHYTGKVVKRQDHFAVFPPELPRICILAGTSARGCCPECGAPWERVTSRNDVDQEANEVIKHDGVPGIKRGSSADRVRSLSGSTYQYVRGATTGWQPTCGCDAGEPVPCTVLDPFSGSGTSGRVAIELGRRYVGLELNREYIKLSHERMTTTLGMAL